MKLKQRPEDFRVEEYPTVAAEPAGDFAWYRLEKRGWTTHDALAAVRRRWKIDGRRLSYGGLKDRHAETIQYFTIFRGPERNLTHEGVTVTYVGRLSHPYSAEHIRANGFQITLRSLSPAALERATAAIPEVADVGVPNYFDDQRFGSVGHGDSFVAREMVRGRFEEALKLALIAPYAHDRSAVKKEKAILRATWGDWAKAKAELPRGHARSLVDYLVHHPTDFRGACARFKPELASLYLSAYQSHLWNRMLSRWVERHVPAEQCMRIRLKTGETLMPRTIPDAARPAWNELSLPLPSARLKFDPSASWAPLVTDVMAEEGLELSDMRIRGMDRPFFSRGERPGRVPVSQVTGEADEDDLNKGRKKLAIRFELPRGCYATMVVKRLTLAGTAQEPPGKNG